MSDSTNLRLKNFIFQSSPLYIINHYCNFIPSLLYSIQGGEAMLPGVYLAKRKDGKTYYRSSITYKNKHISLGSYEYEEKAHQAYVLAGEVLAVSNTYTIEDYPKKCILDFNKWVTLINYRDNGIYIKTPIYLKNKFFLYYIDKDSPITFDIDDLFYYSTRKIMKRGGHLFVAEYGMQVNLLSRYGIKNYGVPGRDYLFVNGDETDYTYNNIKIINRYYGVTRINSNGQTRYLTKVHINGYYIIGRYHTEIEAAIAYNKATLLLANKGFCKEFLKNYIEKLDEIAYASMFQKVRISKKFIEYVNSLDID